MARRRKINRILQPVLTVNRAAMKVKRLVYFLVADHSIQYGKKGSSRILYIGTTKTGARRIAISAVYQLAAAKKLKLRGVKRLDAFVVWAKSKKGPQTKRGVAHWNLLERAILLRFREIYGQVPRLNTQGRKMRKKHEFKTFRESTIDRLINKYN